MSLNLAISARRTLSCSSGLSSRRRRGMRTIARTINLAEPKACSRPRRVQKLVSKDVPASPCPRQDSYRPSRVVPVRICKRQDLERACQPKFCDCPQKLPPKTTKDKLCELVVFSAKSALAAGLVYWTVAEGFWGKPKDTEDFYIRIRETMAPDPTLQGVSLPRLEQIKYKIIDTYNKTVLTVMGFLVGIPMEISKKIRDTLYPCEPIEDEEDKKKKKKKNNAQT